MSSQDDEVKAAAEKTAKTSKPKMKYFRIKMASKRRDDDPDAIEVSAQGGVPILLRFNDECVINETEKCILDSSEITIYKTRITGNKAVLVPQGRRKLYDYSLIGEITLEEFQAARAASKKTSAGEIVQMQRAAEMAAIASGEG